MPVSIPNTTATAAYQDFGVGGVYSSGYLFVANGLVDVQYYTGLRGAQSPKGPFTLSPGLTPLSAGYAPDGSISDPIGGISVAAHAGTLSMPAQQFFGALFEPGRSALSAGSPFTGTLSAGGTVTPGMQNLNVYQNGTLIGAEPGVNFVDGNGVQWSLADVPASSRVNVDAMIFGRELAYDQITAPVVYNSTTESAGTTIIAGSSNAYDGAAVLVELFLPRVVPNSTGAATVTFSLFEGATQIGRLAVVEVPGTGALTNPLNVPVIGKLRFSPSLGNHAYTVTAFDATDNGEVFCGAGGTSTLVPGYLRITKA